jgi:hypothetical protein
MAPTAMAPPLGWTGASLLETEPPALEEPTAPPEPMIPPWVDVEMATPVPPEPVIPPRETPPPSGPPLRRPRLLLLQAAGSIAARVDMISERRVLCIQCSFRAGSEVRAMLTTVNIRSSFGSVFFTK